MPSQILTVGSQTLPPLLEIKKLGLRYKKSANGLVDISLNLNKNEVLGVAGPSGSGKSSLAKAILNLPGLEPEAQISGEILYNGKNLLLLNNREKRLFWKKEIGVVFQDALASLNPFMSIKSQLFEGIESKNERLDIALDLLSRVRIRNPLQTLSLFPHELSGGMRQRVMIAIALAKKPKILILDEPTTALDPTVQACILSMLRNVKQNSEMSILMISHDLGALAGLADRIAIMDKGRLIEEQEVDSFFKKPTHPFSKKLLDAFKQIRSL